MSLPRFTTVPTFVPVPADQTAHPSATDDWWYAVGHLSPHGHEYGYEAQLVASGISQLALTDITAGQYYTQQGTYEAGPVSASSLELDGPMPDAHPSGPPDDMHPTPPLPPGPRDPQPQPEAPRPDS